MSSDAEIERLIEALQQDGPSDRDAARLRARLAGVGIATGVAVHGTASASVPVAKAAASAGLGLSTRWAALSLLPKMGIVATVAATAIGGPLVAVELREPARPVPVRRNDHTREEAAGAKSAPRADIAGGSVPSASDTPAPRQDSVRAMNAGVRVAALSARAVVFGERPPPAPAVTPTRAPVAAPAATTELATAGEESTARFAAEPSAPPPRASSLSEETALIDAAFAALRVQDESTAAALIAEHARRFPQGLLWRERERARRKLATVHGAPGG